LLFQAREISLAHLVFPAPYLFLKGKLMDDETWSVADCANTEPHCITCSFYTWPPPYLSETMGGQPSIADEAETSIRYSNT
jgi:hypothetical protein